MPYGRSLARRTVRRRRTSYRPRVNSRPTVARRPRTFRGRRPLRKIRALWKNPLPNQGFYKFKYRDTAFSLATTIGSGYQATALFRGNGMYDPDASGVGVQPYGYDQLLGATSPFYRYRVYGAKITLYPSITTGNSSCVKFMVMPIPSATPSYTGPDDLAQYRGFKTLKFASVQTSQFAPNKISTYAKTSWFYPKGADESDNTATYGAVPSNQWYFFVIADSAEQAVELTVKFDVQITYYARLMKSDDINES